MNNILIIGATSAIAQAVARRFAARGAKLHLIARDAAKLQTMQQDLQVRGANGVTYAVVDLADTSKHPELLSEAQHSLGEIDVAFIAHGVLGEQRAAEQDYQRTAQELAINLLSPISLLTWLGEYFAKRQQGRIAVISSVAGDRGRQSNYVYGCAKGGLSIFLQGLRNRLHPLGVQVLTIKPGFVDTPMTAHLPKNALFASPEKVALDIEQALEKGRSVLYTPWFWAWIMRIITHIPEAIFIRLKL